MKFSAIIFLIVALLASIAFSAPAESKKDYEKDFKTVCQNIEFKKPVDGIIYKINSTQVADFVLPKDCIDLFGHKLFVTLEVFSIGANAVVDTIVEFEYIYNRPTVFLYLIDKVWANDNAQYFLIATIFHKDYYVQTENKKEYEDEFYKYCQNIEFKKPVDGVMYMINSTQVADFVIPKDCMEKYGSYLMTTVEIFSIGGNKVIDTIIEQEYTDGSLKPAPCSKYMNQLDRQLCCKPYLEIRKFDVSEVTDLISVIERS
ncbi:7355_t:CDS:2 [Funneliformis geosporum]|nr:7355_t:CDS:2 [Funneliformis geosporum]